LIGALRARAVENGGTLPPANDVTQGVGVPTLQFPGTSGGINLPPQSGYLQNPANYSGFTTNVPPSSQTASIFSLDSSTLGILAAVALGGFFLSRR
jgi:hypothetical protein